MNLIILQKLISELKEILCGYEIRGKILDKKLNGKKNRYCNHSNQ